MFHILSSCLCRILYRSSHSATACWIFFTKVRLIQGPRASQGTERSRSSKWMRKEVQFMQEILLDYFLCNVSTQDVGKHGCPILHFFVAFRNVFFFCRRSKSLFHEPVTQTRQVEYGLIFFLPPICFVNVKFCKLPFLPSARRTSPAFLLFPIRFCLGGGEVRRHQSHLFRCNFCSASSRI